MKIQAKVEGELNMHGPGVNWIHKAGDERDFPDEVGEKILTNKNYEKVGVKKPTFKDKENSVEEKSKYGKETDYSKKEKKKKDVDKE